MLELVEVLWATELALITELATATVVAADGKELTGELKTLLTGTAALGVMLLKEVT